MMADTAIRLGVVLVAMPFVLIAVVEIVDRLKASAASRPPCPPPSWGRAFRQLPVALLFMALLVALFTAFMVLTAPAPLSVSAPVEGCITDSQCEGIE